MTKKLTTSLEIGGKTLTLEVGLLAKLATSSVLARLGDTMVLVTVVMGKERTDIDYFPLTVEYIERLYAGGRIKGSRWVKREGRPTDDAVLTARLIDRSVRPLFPKEFKKEVQIIATVLSVDGENSPDVLSVIAASAALAISPIPWLGPVGAVRMGYVKNKENGPSAGSGSNFIVNPGMAEQGLSELDLIVTSLKNKTLMLEAGALQVSEEIALEGIKKAQTENDKIIDFIEDFTSKAGSKKEEVKPNTEFTEMIALLEKSYKTEIVGMIKNRVNKESSGDAGGFIDKIIEEQKTKDEDFAGDRKMLAKAIEYIMFKSIRENTLTKGIRPDGRKIDEIRPISCQVSVLPRTHGSAIFNRGDTQALTIATLGSPRMEQLIESAEGEESKRYIHHYNMPPYSVGEAGRIGFTSRREIGHGALGERAIMAVIPSQTEFPYTIRVVSEILSSNGSTSMAATCGSTLALMDAGVPIKKPVAGIAMGMVSSSTSSEQAKKYVILTDILGLEDFSGDMDFKVAGTDSGITAIQMDVKVLGVTIDQVKEVFERAKKVRLFILEKMIAVIGEGRKGVSEYAPKIEQVQIPVDKIGEVIGPGGRVIKSIIATTGATVDVEDSGIVTISGTDKAAVAKAVEWVKGIVREVKVGEIFEEAEVKRVLPFGAFVEFLPGKEGMVHVSKMAEGFVRNPLDVVKLGQKVKVKVYEIDDQGRTNLTMLFGEKSGGSIPPKREVPANDDQQPSVVPPAVIATPSEHPLARQFRRERFSQGPNRAQGNWRDRRTPGGRALGSAPTTGSRFRKSHY